MRKIKTYKIFESELSMESIKDEIFEILTDVKLKLDGDISVSYLLGYQHYQPVEFYFIELNGDTYSLKGSDSEHEDPIEFILDDSDVADLKSAINYLEQEGYTNIRLCISRDDEDNFDELEYEITIEQAKERLDSIVNTPIEYMEIRLFVTKDKQKSLSI